MVLDNLYYAAQSQKKIICVLTVLKFGRHITFLEETK